jgi:hypothetical protein
MHSIFKKSKITFGYGVNSTPYKAAKHLFPTIFFLKKILITGAGIHL